MTWFYSTDANGNINGVYAVPQSQGMLSAPDTDPKISAYLAGIVPSNPIPITQRVAMLEQQMGAVLAIPTVAQAIPATTPPPVAAPPVAVQPSPVTVGS